MIFFKNHLYQMGRSSQRCGVCSIPLFLSVTIQKELNYLVKAIDDTFAVHFQSDLSSLFNTAPMLPVPSKLAGGKKKQKEIRKN